jgi:hypothetical protein
LLVGVNLTVQFLLRAVVSATVMAMVLLGVIVVWIIIVAVAGVRESRRSQDPGKGRSATEESL